jgi:nucleotide-binding universal stress UspA family protein
MSDKPDKQPILVPVDFSPHAEAALVHASKLAECLQLPLLILHVVHDPGGMPGYYAKAAKKKFLLRMEDVAKEMFDDFVARVQQQFPENKPLKHAEAMLVPGIPVTRILEVVKSRNAAMVVMGSKGEAGLKHLLVGSIATSMVQLAPVPVTIVKANHQK